MKRGKKGMLVFLAVSVCFLTGCKNYTEDGTELLREGKTKEAMTAFEQAVAEAGEKGEGASEGYRGIGMAYYQQEDYESARTNLQRALDEGGAETPVIYNLIGICSMKLEDYDAALAAFERGMTLPDGGVISEGTKEEQTVDYTAAIQEMMRNRIVCYEKKLDWESAKSAMAEYITLYPEDEEAQKEAEFLETR